MRENLKTLIKAHRKSQKEVKRVKYYDHILVKTLKSYKGTLMRFNEDVE